MIFFAQKRQRGSTNTHTHARQISRNSAEFLHGSTIGGGTVQKKVAGQGSDGRQATGFTGPVVVVVFGLNDVEWLQWLRTNTNTDAHTLTHPMTLITHFYASTLSIWLSSCGLRTSFVFVCVYVCGVVRARAVISSHNFPYFYCGENMNFDRFDQILVSGTIISPTLV